MRFGRERGAGWRHMPENAILNYSKSLPAQTIIFTAQTSTNLAQTNSSVILIFWMRRGANFTQVPSIVLPFSVNLRWKRVGTVLSGRREAARNQTKRTITRIHNTVGRYTCLTDIHVIPQTKVWHIFANLYGNGGSALKPLSSWKFHWTKNQICFVLNIVIRIM